MIPVAPQHDTTQYAAQLADWYSKRAVEINTKLDALTPQLMVLAITVAIFAYIVLLWLHWRINKLSQPKVIVMSATTDAVNAEIDPLTQSAAAAVGLIKSLRQENASLKSQLATAVADEAALKDAPDKLASVKKTLDNGVAAT